MLATIKQHCGDLEKVKRVVRLFGMANSASNFERQPAVIDGASGLFLELWRPVYRQHARSAVRMAELPHRIPVEINGEFELHPWDPRVRAEGPPAYPAQERGRGMRKPLPAVGALAIWVFVGTLPVGCGRNDPAPQQSSQDQPTGSPAPVQGAPSPARPQPGPTITVQEPLTPAQTWEYFGGWITDFRPGPQNHFVHAGLPALIDAVYNGSALTLIILDNSTTGMTGQQAHPAAGTTLRGRPAPKVDLEALVRAAGVQQVEVVDTWQRKAVGRAIRGALAHPGPAVVIARGPCMRLPEMKLGERGLTPYVVDEALCTQCDACFKVWCPAITRTAQGFPAIDPVECTACTLCAQVCAPDAIGPAAPGAR